MRRSVGYQKVFADLNDLRMWSEFRTRLTLQAPPLPPRRGPQSESQKEQQVNKSDTFSRRSPSKYTNGKGAQPETHITVPLPKVCQCFAHCPVLNAHLCLHVPLLLCVICALHRTLLLPVSFVYYCAALLAQCSQQLSSLLPYAAHVCRRSSKK